MEIQKREVLQPNGGSLWNDGNCWSLVLCNFLSSRSRIIINAKRRKEEGRKPPTEINSYFRAENKTEDDLCCIV